MAQSEEDLQKIEQIIELMKKNDLAEIEIQHGDEKIMLKRCSPSQPTVTAVPMIGAAPVQAQQTPTSQPASDLVEIKAPMVGTFYATPSPDSEPYVEVGSHVTEQTVVCIIEAMKVMNEIKAEVEGTIEEILVTSGQAVEYGHPLFRVKPD
ncbi:MAG: acetyl-CoA carboxylase biotin carboxyl carrier protein [Phycisphaerales bacterium]|jgi:acetyl-CoA carboxylase biotin carboxyl carrier protein